MAKKNLAEVLQTDVMTNLPVASLAQIVRSKGRGRDTILAHITPREARKLKREGGSGTVNPDTGLPEFEDSFSFSDFPMSLDYSAAQAPAASMVSTPEVVYQAPQNFYNYQPFEATPFNAYEVMPGSAVYPGSFSTTPLYNKPVQQENFGPANYGDLGRTFTSFGAVPGSIQTPEGLRNYMTQVTPQAIAAAEVPLPPPRPEELGSINDAPAASEDPTPDRALRANTPGAPAAAAPVAGAAAAAGAPGSIAAAISSAGLDVSKLSSSDMSRLNQIQSLVANGSMTVEQASTAIQQMAKGQTFSGGVSNWLSDPGNALKLALGLGAGALGLYNMSNAKKQAADVTAQMNKLAGEYRTMAQPLLQQGGQQYGLAAQGALTPAAQQQFDVARAQLAQAAAKTGSVGAMQATQIAEQLRQQAINSQMTQGLQVLAAGNAQMGQALQTQLGALNTNVTLGNQAAQAASSFFPALGMIFGGVKG